MRIVMDVTGTLLIECGGNRLRVDVARDRTTVSDGRSGTGLAVGLPSGWYPSATANDVPPEMRSTVARLLRSFENGGGNSEEFMDCLAVLRGMVPTDNWHLPDAKLTMAPQAAIASNARRKSVTRLKP